MTRFFTLSEKMDTAAPTTTAADVPVCISRYLKRPYLHIFADEGDKLRPKVIGPAPMRTSYAFTNDVDLMVVHPDAKAYIQALRDAQFKEQQVELPDSVYADMSLWY